jgi:hypothetical protein
MFNNIIIIAIIIIIIISVIIKIVFYCLQMLGLDFKNEDLSYCYYYY